MGRLRTGGWTYRDVRASKVKGAPVVARTHLHRDDHPATLTLLARLFDTKQANGEGLKEIGYERSEAGAWVDWDLLEGSWLSTTERAILTIARGCAALEATGGTTPHSEAVIIAVSTVMGRGGTVEDRDDQRRRLLLPSTLDLHAIVEVLNHIDTVDDAAAICGETIAREATERIRHGTLPEPVTSAGVGFEPLVVVQDWVRDVWSVLDGIDTALADSEADEVLADLRVGRDDLVRLAAWLRADWESPAYQQVAETIAATPGGEFELDTSLEQAWRETVRHLGLPPLESYALIGFSEDRYLAEKVQQRRSDLSEANRAGQARDDRPGPTQSF